MNILITGCNGQLGNEMQLLEESHPQHTYFNTDVAELDITNQEAIETFVEANKIDGIVNCAAYTAVDKAEDNEELCTKLNAEAPAYLAVAIGKRGGWMTMSSMVPNIHLIPRRRIHVRTASMARPSSWVN